MVAMRMAAKQVDAREVGDEAGSRPGGHLLGRAGLHHRALLEDDQPVRQRHRLERVVRDQQSHATERRELSGQLTANVGADRDVQGREGLIEQQKLRLGRERAQ